MEEEVELERVRSGASGQSALGKKSADVDLEKGAASGSPTETSVSAVSSNAAESQAERVKGGEKSADGESSSEEEDDPNLVTWDSPDSMENPRNWSPLRKTTVVVIVSSYTFLSPLSSSVIAPALPLLSQQFNVTSSARESLMLSVFVLAYAVGESVSLIDFFAFSLTRFTFA